MKFRNQLLALFCVLLFVGFGIFYVQLWVVQKPFGIIIFVSEGFVARHITAARLYEGGADHRLHLESFPHLALVANASSDYAVPDAAAAATALATGVKTPHRRLGVDESGKPLRSLLELARAQGRAVGLVTNGELTSPVSAAFYAHHADAREREPLAVQLVDKSRLDVVLGGGAADFLPEKHGGRRTDQRDLLAVLQKQKRTLLRTKADLENASSYQEHAVAGLFAAGDLAFSGQVEAGSQQPSLSDMVRRAIEFLQVSRTGYVLVVYAALPGRAAEANQGEITLGEMVALDQAIGTASRYAGEDSLMIAVGTHAVGGLTLNGHPSRKDRGVALLGTSAAGHPSLTWATGPKGPRPASPAGSEPAAFFSPSALHTAEDVIAIGRGDGAEKLRGFMDHTAIFRLLQDAL